MQDKSLSDEAWNHVYGQKNPYDVMFWSAQDSVSQTCKRTFMDKRQTSKHPWSILTRKQKKESFFFAPRQGPSHLGSRSGRTWSLDLITNRINFWMIASVIYILTKWNVHPVQKLFASAHKKNSRKWMDKSEFTTPILSKRWLIQDYQNQQTKGGKQHIGKQDVE